MCFLCKKKTYISSYRGPNFYKYMYLGYEEINVYFYYLSESKKQKLCHIRSIKTRLKQN